MTEADDSQPGKQPQPGQVPLPPVNNSSSLLAAHPVEHPQSAEASGGAGFGVGVGGSSGFSFDTLTLQNALTRSQQIAGSGGGLRRATSAPHSMDLLGIEHAAMQQQQSRAGGGTYLPPTGGPMRRAASSLALRRSSSFFWTPAAHHDFERAISTLTARGQEVTALAIMGEMGHHSADLKLSDVDKHLRKKALLQRRVLQQLDHRPAPLSPMANGHMAADGGLAVSALHGIAPPHSSPAGARAGLRVPGAIAEEPAAMAVPPSHAAAVAAAVSDSLAQQLQAQKMQHMQFAAAREALVADQQPQQQPPPSLS